WHAKFKDGFPVLVLPADHPRSARREFSARRLDHPIPASVVQELRAVAAKQGCSFFAVVLGSLAILLARISRQRRFVIALPTAEQPATAHPGFVGHAVNLPPSRVNYAKAKPPALFSREYKASFSLPRTMPSSRWSVCWKTCIQSRLRSAFPRSRLALPTSRSSIPTTCRNPDLPSTTMPTPKATNRSNCI